MKENSIKNERSSIEEDIEELKRLLYSDKLSQYGKRKLINYYEQQEKNYKRVLEMNEVLLKENEELKKSKITYEAVRDIQEKNRNIVDNNYISKQIVKDNLIKYQEEYELLLEYQSGKESNKTKTLRGRIHMCQELLEGRK